MKTSIPEPRAPIPASLAALLCLWAAPAQGAVECPAGAQAKQSSVPCSEEAGCEEAYAASWCEVGGGLKQGPYLAWFDHGDRKTPRARGAYEAGRRAGPWTYWYRQGQKRFVGAYEGGLRSGWWTIWYETGQLNERGHFVGDAPHGLWVTWYETGHLEARGVYNRGRRSGHWVFRHPDGRPKARGLYVEGHRHGMWRVWDLEGRPADLCYERGRPCQWPGARHQPVE